MRILWITNITFSEALELIGINQPSHFGGWMLSSANTLAQRDDITLYVASVSRHVSQLTRVKGGNIEYFLIPYGKGNEKENPEYEYYWKEISAQATPDVVHIHGTEFTHGLSYVKACGADHVVVSIQGLLHVIARYSTCGISRGEIIRNYTLRDLLFGSSLLSEQKAFMKRGKCEVELFRIVKHVIGRTTWDRAHTLAINSDVNYHHCNETLRESFYEGKWEYGKFLKHTIFLSQGSSALKGAHMVFNALPIVLKKYPDSVIRVAGNSPYNVKKRFGISLMTGYGKYLLGIIKKYHLEDRIQYLGILNEKQMKEEYLRANVFICPSSIENSPNSLGEAQLLGVPCIGSYVGGVPDFISSNNQGVLYRFDDVELLAAAIIKTFESSECFDNKEMIAVAEKRHDKQINNQALLTIYQEVILA